MLALSLCVSLVYSKAIGIEQLQTTQRSIRTLPTIIPPQQPNHLLPRQAQAACVVADIDGRLVCTAGEVPQSTCSCGDSSVGTQYATQSTGTSSRCICTERSSSTPLEATTQSSMSVTSFAETDTTRTRISPTASTQSILASSSAQDSSGLSTTFKTKTAITATDSPTLTSSTSNSKLATASLGPDWAKLHDCVP